MKANAKTITPTFLDPAKLPDVFGLTVRGDCMSPTIRDGSHIVVERNAPVKPGELVCVFLKPEFVPAGQLQAGVKRLVLNIPPFVKFPFKNHPDSAVRPVSFSNRTIPSGDS